MIGKKDQDERVQFGRHWGDWGGVVMAVVFLIGFLAFLFGVNLAGLDKADDVLNRIENEHIQKAEEDTVAGLESAKGYIRFELKERMGVRHVPELSFIADRSGRFQARIQELMDRSRKRQKVPVE